MELDPTVYVRVGYSATGEIVIDRREEVLAIPERYLNFVDDQPMVYVEVLPQVFEPRPLQLGLSDGLMIEILDGLTENDRFRIQATSPEATETI